MNFEDEIKKYIDIIEANLEKILPNENCFQGTVCEAMKYSMFAGGKRIRPILTLKTFELISKEDYTKALPFASAIEMIHTYSLIHDDLPAMDNDDYRRGKLTNHKVYGEDIAILSGDALLNLAYETMLKSIPNNIDEMPRYINAMKEIAKSAGIYGMIGGQTLDIVSNGNIESLEQLDFIHKMKTSALIESSILSGAFLANANPVQIDALRNYGEAIGLCFQIRDDILDVIGENEKLGKATGSDEVNNKLTYLTLHGMEKSVSKTYELCSEAIEALKVFNDEDTLFFKELSKYLVYRES